AENLESWITKARGDVGIATGFRNPAFEILGIDDIDAIDCAAHHDERIRKNDGGIDARTDPKAALENIAQREGVHSGFPDQILVERLSIRVQLSSLLGNRSAMGLGLDQKHGAVLPQ